MRSVLMAAAAAAFVCACSSVTDVSPMGNDTYMVGGKAVGGHMSHTEVKGIALQRADDYCQAKGERWCCRTRSRPVPAVGRLWRAK